MINITFLWYQESLSQGFSSRGGFYFCCQDSWWRCDSGFPEIKCTWTTVNSTLSEKNKPVNTDFCPSRANCQIITIEGFVADPEKRNFYINSFCEAGEQNWGKCRRFQTKKTLNLCPDFVMPDSLLTTDEILDKLEEE